MISLAPEAGGVAYVARLLRMALGGDDPNALRVISLEQRHAGPVSLARAARFTSRIVASNALRRVDWMLFGHPGIATTQRLVPARLRLPYAVQLHGTDAWENPPSVAVRKAALRIAPSRYTSERTRRAFPEIGPIEVCPHGLLPSGVPSGDVDHDLLDRLGEQCVAIVARMLSSERRKGHDRLLEVWPRVLERCPRARLVIAGEGDDAERLRGKAGELGIAASVVFTGFVSDATREALLERTAVFAMPSQQEGFGLVYLEAMRAGAPCIGAVDDGAAEPIVNGETGYLVRHDDAAQLADSIVRLLADRELRGRLGSAGRRRYLADFTFDAYRDRLLRLLSERMPVARSRA